MNVLRAALLTVALALLALLLAWSFRHVQAADGQPARVASVPDAPKKAPPPPAHDFPRRPPREDAVFPELQEEAAVPDVEHPWAAYLRTCAAIRAQLEATKIDLNHQDHDLPTILADIQARVEVRLNLQVPADLQGKRISFCVKDLSAYHVLRLLLQQYDVRMTDAEDGQIWIDASSDDPPLHEPAFARELRGLKSMSRDVLAERIPDPNVENDGKTKSRLDSLKVSYSFQETPLMDVVTFLQEISQLNIMIDRRRVEGDIAATPITATGSDVPFDKALDTFLTGHGLGWRIEAGVLVVTSKEDVEARIASLAADRNKRLAIRMAEEDLFARPVAFGGENLRLREVAEILAKGLGVPFVIDPGTWSRKVRFTIEEIQRPASEIVALLHKGAPVIVTFRDGILWFLSPDGVK